VYLMYISSFCNYVTAEIYKDLILWVNLMIDFKKIQGSRLRNNSP